MTALVLKNDLSWEIVGVEAYDYILFFSFIILLPCSFVLAVASKIRRIMQVLDKPSKTDDALEQRKLAFDLQTMGLAEHSHRRSLKRYFEGWFVRKKFAVFLSHFKMEAAAEARILKNELVRSLRVKEQELFLDSDNLTDLRKLLEHVAESDSVALLYTKGVLSRPWCLLELDAAVKNSVPIFIIKVANAFAADLDGIDAILDDLPACKR